MNPNKQEVEKIKAEIARHERSGLIRSMAEQKVIKEQAHEREDRIRAEISRVRRDFERALYMQRGLKPPSASASGSASASASASAD